MSGSGEAAVDEDPGVANPENEDNEVPNNSDADTEPAMLEDEEMPTYMSLTSSSRPDESRAEQDVQRHSEDTSERDEGKGNRAASPYASDDQGGGSIYVVSSGEESDRAYDDEDYESEEIELEEEEDDEEDDLGPGYNDEEEEEDSDGDIEPEQFERSSDDFVLRYDTGLEKHHKARSRSLQDLTNSRGNLSRFVGKRRSVDIMGHYNVGLARQERDGLRDPLRVEKKPGKSSRYADVPSKVQLYIQSIKEQTRRSAELKSRENPVHKNFNEVRGGNAEVSCTRINPANRMIKGYAQSVINAMMEQDHSIAPDITYVPHRLVENGPEKEPIVALESKQSGDKDGQSVTVVPIPENRSSVANNNLAKTSKPNGIMDYGVQDLSEKLVEPAETCTANGQERIAAIFNLRTLSYDEYANGGQASNKTEVDAMLRPIAEEKNGVVEMMEEDEILGITETEATRVPVSTTVESVKATRAFPEETRAVSNEAEPTNRENPDVAMLWAMLNQKSAQFNEKTAQYDGIRDEFQKTLTENISLKRELEELKKTLAQYRAEKKPPETKTISVQTDDSPVAEEAKIPTNDSKSSSNDSKLPVPKLLSSSVGSVLSSIEQWSDSNCSPAISINPPNMDHVLNSDDSLIAPEPTPRRQLRPTSRSFVTSSRILQTLANITQGRTKTASPLAAAAARNAGVRLETEQGQSKANVESNSPLISGKEANARTRKRTASDMLGFSNAAELFKVPRMPEQPRKKINSDSDTDGVSKPPRKHSRTGSLTEPTPCGSKDDESAAEQTDEFADTEATDVPENVKCFVYHEDASKKERSFLIQAEEPSKNGDVGKIGGGTVRECGPYLLGNVEIRMSEANGTINIWGKEISQESEDMDVEVEKTEESEFYESPLPNCRSSLDSQKTPRAKFNGNSPFVCSTNKKSKISPQFATSGIGKYFRPALLNLARANAQANEAEAGRHDGSPISSNRTPGCEHGESLKKRHFHWPSCDHLSNCRRKQNFCCHQETDANERDCDCTRDRGVLDDEAIVENVTSILTNHKKCTATLQNRSNKHSCANHASEETCRHQSPLHRHSPERGEDCCRAKKRCSSCSSELPSCNARLSLGHSGCCDRRSSCHSYALSCDDQEHPLLQNGHCETTESKRRRLSGKKVRGILTDLLRGCGGCRDYGNASYIAKESTSAPNVTPTVRVTPSTPPQSWCSKHSSTCASHSKRPPQPRDSGNEKCCGHCSRRDEMAAEIESKLEFLTVELERLRSRSDTFREMLNLLNADTD